MTGGSPGTSTLRRLSEAANRGCDQRLRGATMSPDDLVEIEIEAIKRLKYRYMRCLDQKLWDELASCFISDAKAEYSGGAYSYEGRQAIVEFMRTAMDSLAMLSSHRVHHPEIDLTGPDSAVGVWAMEDVVIRTDLDVNIQGPGFYRDRYLKLEGTWLIAETGYRRTYEEVLPRSSVKGLRLTGDWWSTDGRSTLA
jgi:hypothetical protein